MEAGEGGLYRSDDAGDSWELVNDTDGRGRPGITPTCSLTRRTRKRCG